MYLSINIRDVPEYQHQGSILRLLISQDTKITNYLFCLLKSYLWSIQFVVLVDGVWSELTDFGNCTRESGGGVQEQFRSCENPKPSCSCGGHPCTEATNQIISFNPSVVQMCVCVFVCVCVCVCVCVVCVCVCVHAQQILL